MAGKTEEQSQEAKALVEDELKEYLHMKGGWINAEGTSKEGTLNLSVAREITQLIDVVHPPRSAEIKEKISTYMPLKVCLFGSTLSGRHTQAIKLSQKYGVSIIDLKEVIKEALILANPPAEDKKGAKKDPKKAEEEKPEKIKLRELGTKLKDRIKTPE